MAYGDRLALEMRAMILMRFAQIAAASPFYIEEEGLGDGQGQKK